MREIPIPSLAALAAIHQQIDLEKEPEDVYHLNETSERTAGRHRASFTQLNAELNHIFRPRAPDFFLHPGRVSIVSDPATTYEQIFSTPGLSRRVQRVHLLDSSDSSPDLDFDWDSTAILHSWFDQCLSNPFPYHSDHQNLMPQALEYMEHPTHKHDAALLDFLPERLRWNSEQGRFFKQSVRKLLELPPSQSGQLIEYEDEAQLGDGTKETVKNCFGETAEMLPFVGTAAEGHLICRPWTGFPVVKGDSERMCRYAKMSNQLSRADQALVELARRVAGWVARKIVYGIIVPETYRRGCEVLNREQINSAVKEILGEEWFDMPCDQIGKLRNWSVDEVFEPGVEIEVDGDGGVTQCVRTEEA